MSKTRFYSIWDNLLRRTTNSNNPAFKDYGGRGIRCTWLSFDDFKRDMYQSYLSAVKKFGEKNTYIERIDNNASYSKNNCTWSNPERQANNRRSNHFVTYNKKTMSLADWERFYELPKCILWQRITKYKWPIEKALLTPSKSNKNA